MSGIYSGMFYDAAKTREYCGSMKNSAAEYHMFANEAHNAYDDFSQDESFHGTTATEMKQFMTAGAGKMLTEITDINKQTVDDQDYMISTFEEMVDAAPEARIEYDTLETIGEDFRVLYGVFKEIAESVRSIVSQLIGEFGSYKEFKQPDSESAVNNFTDFCGGESREAGYISECQDKLVSFDETVSATFKERDTIEHTQSLDNRFTDISGILAELTPENDIKPEDQEVAPITNLNFMVSANGPTAAILGSSSYTLHNLSTQNGSTGTVTQTATGSATGVPTNLPSYVLAAIASAQAKSKMYNKNDPRRQAIMEKYGISEVTMEKVDEWIENYNENGDNDYEAILRNFEGMTSNQLRQALANEKDPSASEDLAAVCAMMLVCSEIMEDENSSPEDVERASNIMEELVVGLYHRDSDPNSTWGTTGDVTPNQNLIKDCKLVLEATEGGKDSLAYNILTKCQSDTETHQVEWVNGEILDIKVNIEKQADGFYSVEIENGYEIREKTYQGTTKFLAIGKKGAEEYAHSCQVDGAKYHGVTWDQEVALIMTVETPTDKELARRLLSSDENYHLKAEDESAFNLSDAKFDKGVGFENGISDVFSVGIAQYTMDMLMNGNDQHYLNFANALLDATASTYQDDELLLEIASGAGVLADVYAAKAYNEDPTAPGNEDLERSLNLANINYGFYGDLYERFGHESSWTDVFYNKRYTNFRLDNFVYNDGTKPFDIDHNGEKVTLEPGSLICNIHCDYTEESYVPGMGDSGGHMDFNDENNAPICIESHVLNGWRGMQEGITDQRRALRDALDKKEQDIVIETMFDLVGVANPVLKDCLYLGKDALEGSNAVVHSGNLSKDAVKVVLSEDPAITNAFSAGSTIASAVSKYNKAISEYEKDQKNLTELQKLSGFYSYNSGANSVGLYDYDTIRLIRKWNDGGISALGLGEGVTNQDVEDRIYNDNGLNPRVIARVGTDLLADPNIPEAQQEKFDALRMGEVDDTDISKAYDKIEKGSGYSQGQIENAMQVLINGYQEDGEYYNNINDIPFDLMNACLNAISWNDGIEEDIADIVGDQT